MNLIYKIKTLISLAKGRMKEIEDKDALEVLELYPNWKSEKAYAVGDRVQYDGKLWKVLQAHTSQDGWRPDTAVSLFTQVVATADEGTLDNPIEYSVNMELVEGLYYKQNDVIYLCIRALAQCVWDLSALVGNYVQVV